MLRENKESFWNVHARIAGCFFRVMPGDSASENHYRFQTQTPQIEPAKLAER